MQTRTLGERILLARKRQGMTQEQLAIASGVTSNTIARVERGIISDLSGTIITHLAKALQISSDQLLGIDKED